MRQPARGRTLIHLVNGTGHQDTAYFPPVELRGHSRRASAKTFAARVRSNLDSDLLVTTDGR